MESSSNAAPDTLKRAGEKMVNDMNFVSIFVIIYGVLSSLSIVGLIFGIPYIFIGLRLKDAATAFRQYLGGNDTQQLAAAFDNQAKSFFIMKVLIFIGIAFFVLMIIGMIIFFAVLAGTGEFDDVMTLL